MRALMNAAIENIRGLIFVAGNVWFYRGVAGFSAPAADIVAGAALMIIGSYPYMRRPALPRQEGHR